MSGIMLKELFNQHGIILWATSSLENIINNADNYKYIAFCLPYNDAAVDLLPDEGLIDICKNELFTKSKIIYTAIKEKFEKYNFESYDDIDKKFALFQKGISQKVLAHYAGLGWIGRSSLLITTQFGPRVRIGTLFTKDNLGISGFLNNGTCGECKLCLKICPSNAISEKGYDVNKCKQITIKSNGERIFCGLCMQVCPYGKKNKTIKYF